MSLIITFMLEPAKLQMNCANAKGRSARRNAVLDPPAAPVSPIAYPSGTEPVERVAGPSV
jgi:hypothetical protein